MLSVVALVGGSLFAPAGGLAAEVARAVDEVAEAARWYPLAAGRSWTYQTGGTQITVRVAGAAEGGSILETVVGDKVVSTEVMQTRPDGVSRTRLNGQAVTPPARILALAGGRPAADGTEWAVDSQIGGQGLSGRFTVGRERVTVPAGEFEAVACRGPNFTVLGTPVGLTYWFARDVGIVRLAYRIGDTEAELNLVEFAK